MAKEFISCHPNYQDECVCVCGNQSIHGEFFMCDDTGVEVGPEHPIADTGLWACERCGRVINYATKQVIGKLEPSFRFVQVR